MAADPDKLVILMTRSIDSELSSVALTIALGGLTAGLKDLIFLTSAAVDVVRRRGYEQADCWTARGGAGCARSASARGGSRRRRYSVQHGAWWRETSHISADPVRDFTRQGRQGSAAAAKAKENPRPVLTGAGQVALNRRKRHLAVTSCACRASCGGRIRLQHSQPSSSESMAASLSCSPGLFWSDRGVGCGRRISLTGSDRSQAILGCAEPISR
jgi:hypothetical protein